MDTIRIGIVGGGSIVKNRHMPGLRAIDGVEIAAVCNSTPESSERFANEYGVTKVYSDWRELVQSRDLDAVLIGTWPYLHKDVSVMALENDKHVFCQARMAMNAREAREMNDAAEKSGNVAMVCPAPTGIAGDRLMQRLLSENYVGQVYAIHVRALGDSWASPVKDFHWRLDGKLSGLNALAVGLYVEWVHRWFGSTRRISAEVMHCIPERRNPATGDTRRVDTPDIVLAHGQMASGAVVNYEFSGVHRHAGDDVIEVYGSEGTLRYVVGKDEIAGGRDGSFEIIPCPGDLVRPWDVESIWIDGIRTGSAVSPSFSDGLAYMDVTEAIHRSALTGRAIDLPMSDRLRGAPLTEHGNVK